MGLFVAGSLAAGTADAHSDIDLRVVVEPGAWPRFCADRLSRPTRGELIYAQRLLDGLREWLVILEDLLEDRWPGLDCSFRIEKRVSSELREALYAACPRSDAAELQAALTRLLPICRALICRLHERSKLASPAPFLRALDALAE